MISRVSFYESPETWLAKVDLKKNTQADAKYKTLCHHISQQVVTHFAKTLNDLLLKAASINAQLWLLGPSFKTSSFFTEIVPSQVIHLPELSLSLS